MFNDFTPDYRNLVDAARNKAARRLPVYEHLIAVEQMEAVVGRPMLPLWGGDDKDLREYFRLQAEFTVKAGYDAVNQEFCLGGAFPGCGALGSHKIGAVRDRADYDRYPWESVPDRYFELFGRYYDALRDTLPPGMKAVGGVGNGIFEAVEDIVGYMDLCYMKNDDPDLYASVFRRVGEIALTVWKRMIKEYGDSFCILRFGDDMGFKTNTLISHDDLRAHVFPWYKKIVAEVHAAGKPFILHSCGNIIPVMDDLINDVRIDAKHSNEDIIAPFSFWVDTYGDRIGNFGGIDTDVLCRADKPQMKEYILGVLRACEGKGGVAIGSGNSIPNYIPTESYLYMLQVVREYRGEKVI